jgi:hypothetical protein
MCSLVGNNIGDEGATAISRGLASVTRLEQLLYVAFALGVRTIRVWDLLGRSASGGWVPGTCATRFVCMKRFCMG